VRLATICEGGDFGPEEFGIVDQAQIDAALQELSEEQALLNKLRSDYAIVTRSRLFGLRALWSSTKSLFGARYASAAPINRPSSVLGINTHSLLAKAEYARLVGAWHARAAARPLSETPLVSVVIPAHNHIDATVACLQSIADTWFETLAVQIILVDDGSQDETSALVALLQGVDVVSNGSNQGFVRACNRGAAIARGKYICFLNNDTIVRNAWLDELVSVAEADHRIGAVGAKLVYPDGKLQEAGAIIFRDGNGWNYGRSGNPDDPRYNFVREVDYCSGAALLVRAAAFRDLGGFDDQYAPAYYEDADLCFGLRTLGLRVVYQPRSVVVHREGLSSGTDLASGAKRFQEFNRVKFAKKWGDVLQRQAGGDAKHVANAARRRRGRTILIIDSYVPLYDKEAGSDRLFKILKILVDAGYYVFFLPDNYAPLQPYTSELQALGIEVLHHVPEGRPAGEALDETLPMLDFAWICRPELFEKYAPIVRRNNATRIIYDTIDLHFVRKKREAELLNDPDSSAWKEMERIEVGAARSAHITLTVNDQERAALVERGVSNVVIVPTIHNTRSAQQRPFGDRDGILFIGGYNHPPNVDAAQWLCSEIMPLVWARLPGVTLTLLGSNPSQSVRNLATDRVSVPGYLRDVSSYFERSRVFVAPIRFGAGLKGKIGHSLEFGLPVVTTTVGAEGFPLRNEENCYIADTAEAFADAVVRLYTSEATWSSFASASDKLLGEFTAEAVGPRICEMLEAR